MRISIMLLSIFVLASTTVSAQSVGDSAWLLSGNNISSGQSIGSNNNSDLIFKTNGIERMNINGINGSIRFLRAGWTDTIFTFSNSTYSYATRLLSQGGSSMLKLIGGGLQATIGNDANQSTYFNDYRGHVFTNDGTTPVVGVNPSGQLVAGNVSSVNYGNFKLQVDGDSYFNGGLHLGNGTSLPHASSILDIASTTKGLLPPRMTAAQRLGISSPAASLFVWDTDSSRYMGYNGTEWKGMKWADEGGVTNEYILNTTSQQANSNLYVSGNVYGSVLGAGTKITISRTDGGGVPNSLPASIIYGPGDDLQFKNHGNGWAALTVGGIGGPSGLDRISFPGYGWVHSNALNFQIDGVLNLRNGTSQNYTTIDGATGILKTSNLDFSHTGNTNITNFSSSFNGGFTVNPTNGNVAFIAKGVTDNYLLLTHVSTNRIGIGTASPQAKLDVAGSARFNNTLFINEDGTIAMGIVTSFPSGYKLAVAGNIIAEKVRIKLQSGWPDYVFSPNYKLPSLQEVEKFIQEHKHLPGIPSAREVEQNGLDLGDGQAMLLKKIEELTLHVIEMNKKVMVMEDKINKLTIDNEGLKREIEKGNGIKNK